MSPAETSAAIDLGIVAAALLGWGTVALFRRLWYGERVSPRRARSHRQYFRGRG